MEIEPGTGPEPSGFPEHDYTVSATGLVSRTFSLWIRRLPEYLVLAGLIIVFYLLLESVVVLIIMGPSALILFSSGGVDTFSLITTLMGLIGVMDPTFMVLSIVFVIGDLIVGAIAVGASIKLALDDYGNPGAGSIGTSFSHVFGRIGRIIGIQLLVGLIALAIMGPGLLLILSAIPVMYTDPTAVLQMMLIGGVVLMISLVVVLYVTVRLAPAVAVGVAEEEGVIGSIKRAFNLTSGNFWHVFFGELLLVIVVTVIETVIGMITSPLSFAVGLYAILISSIISAALLTAINPIFLAVLYKDLVSRAAQREQQWW